MRAPGLIALALAAQTSPAAAAATCDLNVLMSGAFAAAYRPLEAAAARAQGKTLCAVEGPSGGAAPTAIPNRVARGEPVDVVIVTRASLDDMAGKGQLASGSETDLVRSSIAMAVRKGAPKPDISTPNALRKALLDARSVIVADGFSGVYLTNEVYPRLGIAAQMAGKSKAIAVTPVGVEVAEGRAEVGFQQLSEFVALPGVDVVGLIPDSLQLVTVYTAAVSATSKDPEGARALIRYLASDAAWPAMREAGLAPVAAK